MERHVKEILVLVSQLDLHFLAIYARDQQFERSIKMLSTDYFRSDSIPARDRHRLRCRPLVAVSTARQLAESRQPWRQARITPYLGAVFLLNFDPDIFLNKSRQ